MSDDYFVHENASESAAVEAALQGQMALQPGDVLYLRRRSAGPEAASTTANANRRRLMTSPDRIPLRRIGSESACGAPDATGRLYDYEREFLIIVLAANRTSTPDATTPADDRATTLESVLRQNEVALWNCLVENLSIRRATAESDADARAMLQLRVNMDGLLEALPDDSPARSYFRTGTQDFVGLDASRHSPYETLTGRSGAGDDVDSATDGEPVFFDFVTAELNGVSVQRPQWPERQWTLMEWDQAGVLVDKYNEESRLLVVKFSRGGDRFYVAECFGLDPTHHVDVAMQDGRPTRELVRGRSGFGAWFKTLHQGAAIPQADLDDLVLADVKSVEVGSGTRCGTSGLGP